MNGFISCSTYAYRTLLVFYPVELRYEYGEEMTQVFAEELAEAWQSRRFGDVAAIWYRATSEILHIAIPRRLSNWNFPAPAMGMMVQLAVLAGMLALATFAREAMPHDTFHGVVMLRR